MPTTKIENAARRDDAAFRLQISAQLDAEFFDMARLRGAWAPPAATGEAEGMARRYFTEAQYRIEVLDVACRVAAAALDGVAITGTPPVYTLPETDAADRTRLAKAVRKALTFLARIPDEA